LGIEIPVYIPLIEAENTAYFLAYLDVVVRDKRDNKITIIDIKTSTKGWSKWKKADRITTAQLPMYKKFFSLQYSIPLEDIDIEYFILKSTLYEDIEYPQSRLQRFSPASGKVTLNKVNRELQKFLDIAYNEQGLRDKNVEVEATTGGVKDWNCTFCPFKDRHDLCDPKKRLKKTASFE
jgi:hypothetical protein